MLTETQPLSPFGDLAADAMSDAAIARSAHANGVPPVSPVQAAVAKPLLTLRATSGWAALNLAEVWRFRDLLFSLAGRDVRLRYRQTVLGAAWVVLQPLMAAAIFAFVFGKVAGLTSGPVSDFLFAFTGLLAWNAFSTILSKASMCLIGSAHLISKVYFPRLILPLSTVPSALIDFAVALAVLVVLMAAKHAVPGWGILLLPVWLALILLLATGAGLIAAALTVRYRDVQYILPVFTQFLLFASPVAYAVTKVPVKWRAFYFFNPLSGLLEAFRWSVLGPAAGSLHWGYLAYSTAFAIAIFILGAFWFKAMERSFADII